MLNQEKKIFCKQNIPNMLLVLRMILVPIIIGFLIANQYITDDRNQIIYSLLTPFNTASYYSQIRLFFLIAGVLFVFASFTDWLDGHLARKYNWVSDFGKLWDPIADKVLINSVLICFAWATLIPVFVPIIMIIRDVCVDAQKMVAAKKGVVVAANYWGKLKTVLQMIATILIFFLFNHTSVDIVEVERQYIGLYWGVQNIMMLLACVMSITSGIIYFIDINKAIKDAKQN